MDGLTSLELRSQDRLGHNRVGHQMSRGPTDRYSLGESLGGRGGHGGGHGGGGGYLRVQGDC